MCKTGCKTGRCSCRKKGQTCSEGCSCVNCLNLPVSVDIVEHFLEDISSSSESESVNDTEKTSGSDTESESQDEPEQYMSVDD